MQRLELVEGLVEHTITVLTARHFFNLVSLLVLWYSELCHVTVCNGFSSQQWSGKHSYVTVEALAIEITLQVDSAMLLVNDSIVQVNDSTVWVD